MEFKDNIRPIYLQIADRICDDIMSGKYPAEARIPSVREYAAQVQVNANTVMRSFDMLCQRDIIFNRRGIGYFVSPNAQSLITALRQETFFATDAVYFFSRLQSMDISPEQLATLYQDYINNNS
ncbi:MAG: GntR family transcriptional regulator [Bacteroidales bacterium]|nr:GntR family transcriptional regulator [Bacteroidales bacterium]